MKTCGRSIVLQVENAEQGGNLGPQQRYRNPQIEVKERALGRVEPGMIRIEMSHVGVCGTDLHLLETIDGGFIRCSSPCSVGRNGRVIGHEGVGVVRVAGEGVRAVAVGDLVCLESIICCMTCRKCRQGQFNQCENSLLLGMQSDGLFGDFADVPAELAHSVNDLAHSGVGLEGLACVEPAAVAYLACRNAGIVPGERVAVLGAGPIGYYVALMAKTLFGAARVTVSEVSEYRRKFAEAACDEVVDQQGFAEGVAGMDVLIDAAGALGEVSAAIPRMNGNGRIVFLARTGGALHLDAMDEVISQSLHLIGSRGHLGGAVEAVLELARSGRLDLQAPVTRVVEGLDALAEVLVESAGVVGGR